MNSGMHPSIFGVPLWTKEEFTFVEADLLWKLKQWETLSRTSLPFLIYPVPQPLPIHPTDLQPK